MGTFAERPVCYKVGIFLLLLATAVFLGSIALPWWAQIYSSERHEVTRHTGLWVGCVVENETTPEQCSSIIAPDWFKSVQGLQCAALSLMLLACGYALFTNCCLNTVIYSRTVELLAGFGGIVGFLGNMVYVTKTSPILKLNREITYSWAFAADLAACIIVIIIAGVIGVSNTREDDGEDRSLFLEEVREDLACTRSHRGRLAGVSTEDVRSGVTATGRSPALPRSAGPNTEVFVVQNNYPRSDNAHPTPSSTCAASGNRNGCCTASAYRCCQTSHSGTTRDEAHELRTEPAGPSSKKCTDVRTDVSLPACSASDAYKSYRAKTLSAAITSCSTGEMAKPSNAALSSADTSLPSYTPQSGHSPSHPTCCSCRGKGLSRSDRQPMYRYQDGDVRVDQSSESPAASAPPPEYSHMDFATAQFIAGTDSVTLPRHI